MGGTQVDDADQPEANGPRDQPEVDVDLELRRLLDLYRFGVLTDAEFLREETKLLGPG